MKGNRMQIGAVVLALVMTLSVVSFGIASAGASLTSDDTRVEQVDANTDDTQIAEIGGNLEEAASNDEIVQAVVMLERLDSAVIQSQGAQALQQHAEQSQQVLRTYADENDGFNIQNSFWITNAVVVEINTGQTDLDEIAGLDGVEELVQNFEIDAPQPVESSSDVETGIHGEVTYGLDQLDVPEAWDSYDVDGDDARVAVLDTGVDASHPDLEVADFAEIDGDGNVVGTTPFDPGRHGTHVSGTVSGGDASGEHIGVAPNVELMVGQVLQGDNNRGLASVIGGMEWAVDNDADVISMSLGTSPDRQNQYAELFIDPVRNAKDVGTFVIAATGNGGQDGDGVGDSGSPGNVYETLAVGATNANQQVTGFSSGEEVNTQQAWGNDAPSDWPSSYIVPDVVGPGQDVKSSIPGGEYDELSGTSMATPHVAGVVALMIDAAEDNNIEYTVDGIEQALFQSAWKPDDAPSGKDNRYGEGIVDAERAIDNFINVPPDLSEPGFELTDAEAQEGDTVTVELRSVDDVDTQRSPPEPPEFAGFETTIEYDPSVLEFVGVENGDMDNLVSDNEEGLVSLSAVDTQEGGERTIAALTFEVVAQDQTAIEFVENETYVSDIEGNLLDNYELEDAQVGTTPPPTREPDFNDDGDVNIADATILQQYILGNDVPESFDEEAADLNDDGQVNTGDLIQLLERITNLD